MDNGIQAIFKLYVLPTAKTDGLSMVLRFLSE